jgi:hypothetical protein
MHKKLAIMPKKKWQPFLYHGSFHIIFQTEKKMFAEDGNKCS